MKAIPDMSATLISFIHCALPDTVIISASIPFFVVCSIIIHKQYKYLEARKQSAGSIKKKEKLVNSNLFCVYKVTAQ